MTIYHITTTTEWEAAQAAGQYTAPSLTSEGFIHTSTREQVAGTANRFYRGVTGLALLVIDLPRVTAAVRFDPVSIDGELTEFPHIYGPLNLDAVQGVLPFEPDADGSFVLPPQLAG